MGIQKRMVQSLLFNAVVHGNKFGVEFTKAPGEKAAVMIFDHSLVVCMGCYRTPKTDMKTHCVNTILGCYKQFRRYANILILCEDGDRSVKLAVREQRDRVAPPEALVYYKAHRTEVMTEILDRMTEERINAIYVRGRVGEVVTWSVTSEHLGVDLHMADFAKWSRELESDTLMFEFMAHYRMQRPTDLIVLTSRDTDLLITALSLYISRGCDFFGNTLILFDNGICSFTKDFDRCAIGDYRLLPSPVPAHPEAESFLTDDKLMWRLLFDADPEDMPRFRGLIARTEDELFSTSPRDRTEIGDHGAEWKKLFLAMWKMGIRGSAFRRVLLRLFLDCQARDVFVSTFAFGQVTTDVPLASLLRETRVFTASYSHPETPPMGADGVECLGDPKLCLSYDEAADPLTRETIDGVVAVAKMYRAGLVPLGGYGRFIAANSFSMKKFVRVSATPYANAVVTACILAGTDHNMSLSKLGVVQATQLLECPAFRKACDDHLGDREASQALDLILSQTKIYPKNISPEDFALYKNCVWRTLNFAFDLWSLRCPSYTEDYGFAVDGSGKINFSFKGPIERSTFILKRK